MDKAKQKKTGGFSRSPLFAKVHVLFWCLFLASNCMKKPDMTEDDGPVMENNELRNSVTAAWGDFDLLQIKKNEFVAIRQTQEVQSASSTQSKNIRVIREEGLTVCDRLETSDAVAYDFLHQIKEYKDGNQSQQSTTRVHFPPLAKTDSGTAALLFPAVGGKVKPMDEGGTQLISLLHNLNAGLFWILYFMQMCEKTADYDVSCHQLNVTDEIRPAPEDVKNQPQCLGLPDCQMSLKKISFVHILNAVDETTHKMSRQKTLVAFSIAKDLPYLSHLVDYCFTGLMPVGEKGQKILVKVCNELTSFRLGDNSSLTCQTSPN